VGISSAQSFSLLRFGESCHHSLEMACRPHIFIADDTGKFEDGLVANDRDAL
jgi:hypothetical protein